MMGKVSGVSRMTEMDRDYILSICHELQMLCVAFLASR